MAYKLTPKAKEDLLSIVIYTLDVWGQNQARDYISGLKTTFSKLEFSPNIGKNIDFIRVGYQIFFYKKHGTYPACLKPQLCFSLMVWQTAPSNQVLNLV